MIQQTILAFIDTETGGLTAGVHPVLEIATILTDFDLKEIARIELKVKPRAGDKIDPQAARINGYTPEGWKDAKPFAEYSTWLAKHVPYGTIAIPVGHNVGFDRDMIDLGYYKPTGKFCPLSYHKIDTVGIAAALQVAGKIKPMNLKLASVAEAMGIKNAAAHRAMGDCETSMKIFTMFSEMLKFPLKCAKCESKKTQAVI